MEKEEKIQQTKYDQKAIKKMNRRDLLEVLVAQGKRIEELEASNVALKEELDRANLRLDSIRINPEDVSAISEASNKISSFFLVAQDALKECMSKAEPDQVAKVASLLDKTEKEYLQMTEAGRKVTEDHEEETE